MIRSKSRLWKDSRSKNMMGINNHRYGKKAWNVKDKIRKVCMVCNKEFLVHPFREKSAIYCSKRCVAKGSKNGFKKGHKPYIFIKENCKEERNKNGNSESKKWRTFIFLRDNFTCQICEQVGGRLEAHHIKSWSKYPSMRYELTNGVTLCKECHKKTDNYAGLSKYAQ
jgi:5-methylcytosine-specific restriction endonuclease McrA